MFALHNSNNLYSDVTHPSNFEIEPVPSCSLLSQGAWNILCQRGTTPQAHAEILCAVTSVEGLGSLAVQAEISHFARQDFRYRRFCCRALYLGLLSVINLLEGQRALERAHEREEQFRHLVHSNALARREERERISLRLHDSVIQSMVSAFHMVEAIRETNIHKLEQAAVLQKAEEALSQAIRDHSPNFGGGQRIEMNKIRILVVDDHPVVRVGLAATIGRDPALEVVGEAGDGLEALQLASELKPDVVLMDLRLPRQDGIQATREIKRDQPDIAVIILSAYDDEAYVRQARDAGAGGYLFKDSSGVHIRHTIKAVHNGEASKVSSLTQPHHQNAASDSDLFHHYEVQPAQHRHPLTPREMDVLKLLN